MRLTRLAQAALGTAVALGSLVAGSGVAAAEQVQILDEANRWIKHPKKYQCLEALQREQPLHPGWTYSCEDPDGDQIFELHRRSKNPWS